MASETEVQQFVHKLEEGGWAVWVLRALLVAAILFNTAEWFFNVTIPLVGKGPNGFKGLWHEKAIEQAQIAREIARGHGFSTKMIRPAAVWQFKDNTGVFNLDQTPDTYHAPLSPFLTSFALRFRNFVQSLFSKEDNPWQMSSKELSYPHDKVIAGFQLLFFLLAVLVAYFTAKRLFDVRLANYAVGLLLLCERFWDFSMSGLPQMLMLFLFSCTIHALVRALQARNEATAWWPWLLGVGLGFGLLALAHGLTIWIFLGAIAFCLILFTPRWKAAACLVGMFALCYVPWLIRNHQVCHDWAGLGWYSALDEVRGSESQVMRTIALEGPLKDVSPWQYRDKLQHYTLAQLGSLYWYLGYIIVAPMFFVALMHRFKRKETAQLQWGILLMWLFAALGMAAFGLEPDHPWPFAPQVKANDLHVLFIPVMTFYGLAFLLVLWSRLEINVRWVRMTFLTLVFLLSSIPFIVQFIDLNSQMKAPVVWPPYVPHVNAQVAEMMTEREVIMADMPWAMAWYGDRKSLWLPMKIENFTDLNDYNQLGGRIVGLFLSPYSANRPLLSEIAKGEYKEWAAFILRQLNSASLKDFPLSAYKPLEPGYENIIYFDRDRWTTRED